MQKKFCNSTLRAFRVSTTNRSDAPPIGVYSYRIRLDAPVSNVVAAELSAWSMPRSLANPFVYDKFFQLILSGPALPTKTLLVEMPDNFYVYSWTDNLANSYIDTMVNVLNDAAASDIDYATKVHFVAVSDPLEHTNIGMATLPYAGWSGDGTLSFQLGFAGIVNSCHEQCGFEVGFYASTFRVNVPPYPAVQLLRSPFSVNLNPYRYVDVFVREFSEHQPFHRILLQSSIGDANTSRNSASFPMRILAKSDRSLEYLTIDMRLSNGRPPTTLDSHDLTFVVVCQQHHIDEPPPYTQSFFELTEKPAAFDD